MDWSNVATVVVTGLLGTGLGGGVVAKVLTYKLKKAQDEREGKQTEWQRLFAMSERITANIQVRQDQMEQKHLECLRLAAEQEGRISELENENRRLKGRLDTLEKKLP